MRVYERWFSSCTRLWPIVLQACTFMTDGSTLERVYNRRFYRCSPCTIDSSRGVQCTAGGSTVVHCVVQLFTLYDRWLYSSSRCMTDGSAVVYGAWPIVIQLCMLYGILSPYPNSFRFIDLPGVSFNSISVSTGNSDPCSSRNTQRGFNYLANFCSCDTHCLQIQKLLVIHSIYKQV